MRAKPIQLGSTILFYEAMSIEEWTSCTAQADASHAYFLSTKSIPVKIK